MAGVIKVWTGAVEYCCGIWEAAAAMDGTVLCTCCMSWIEGISAAPEEGILRELWWGGVSVAAVG